MDSNAFDRRERLITLGAMIRSKRDELSDLEREFDSLVNAGTNGATARIGAVAAGGVKVTPATEALVSVDASLPQRIMARVNLNPDRVYGAEDFDDLRRDSSIQTLRSALFRLADKGLLVRTNRGRFKQAMRPLFAPQQTGGA